MLTKVVLPAPLAPIRLTFWPAAMSSVKGIGGDNGAKPLVEARTERTGFTAPPLFSPMMAAAVAALPLPCRSRTQSEPMPRGRNKITPQQENARTSCQVFGR